jgi:hypothetical protein
MISTPVIIGVAIAIPLVLALLKVLYVLKTPASMPARKPLLCVLPKYWAIVNIDAAILNSDDPTQVIVSSLEALGFHVARQGPHRVELSRGHILGDFSIKIAKLNVRISLPADQKTKLTIEYGALFGAAFDTGDLWRVTTQLIERLQADVIAAVAPITPDSGNPYQSPQI